MSWLSNTRSASTIRLSQLPALTRVLGEFFASRGVDAYLVGGLVRDALLGRVTKDIDIAVPRDVLEIGRELAEALSGHLVPLDVQRGLVRVVVAGEAGNAFVDLGRMAGGILDDLARRDFTINAMAVPLADLLVSGEARVIDPLGGQADLQVAVIRALNDRVFQEDPVRLVRGPRLAAQLRFRIEEGTASVARRDAALVNTTAPERVRDEFLKLLAQPGPTLSLRLLDSLGLLSRLLPELDAGRGVTQPREHHWDVFQHCLETPGQVERLVVASAGDDFVAQAAPRFEGMGDYFGAVVSDGHTRLTLLKLAGLLHDVGKPATRSVERSGRIRFLGHHMEGARQCRDILRRLRFSRRGVDMVARMVEYHLRPRQLAQRGELPTPRAVYRYYRDLGDVAVDTLYLNLADYLAARGPLLSPEEWAEHCRVIAHVLREGVERKPEAATPRLLDGHDIMEVFGLSPGPQVGQLLELVREAQGSGEVKDREEALALVRSHLRRQHREVGGNFA